MMHFSRTWPVLLLVSAALLLSGCNSKEKAQLAAVKQEVTKLSEKVNQLEAQSQLAAEASKKKEVLTNEERYRLQENIDALKVQSMHASPDNYKIDPQPPTENGWFLIGTQHTFTLLGHEQASRVRFYASDAAKQTNPELLAEDRISADGWVYRGPLPFGDRLAFWAEATYPGGVTVTIGSLPIIRPGK